MKSKISVVAIGVASSIFSVVFLLPSTYAECVLTGDPCSSGPGADECCFAQLGAVCDISSNGGSCCFPTKDDTGAYCIQNDDCCGDLLCIANVCSDTIAFKSQMAQYKIVEAETEYGSGNYAISSVMVQQDGSDPVVFELDLDGEVNVIYSGGVQLYPIPETSSRRLKAETNGPTRMNGMKHISKNRSETDRSMCNSAVKTICRIPKGLACKRMANVRGVGANTCAILAAEARDAAAAAITARCERIVDCTGDPHMQGFQGQKFDFSGKDGAWYAVLHDESFYVNMRVTAPIPDLNEITYITALGISITDDSGDDHTIVVSVDHPLEMQTECPNILGGCLADGALTVELDGIKMTTSGEVSLGGGVFFSAVNIPGECRPFGFETYWQKKAAAQSRLVAKDQRRLDLAPTSLWILSDDKKTNPVECRAYVRSGIAEGTILDYQSEHTSIQIKADNLSIRVNHGKIHQLAVRDPTDQYDLPDHIAYQMNIDFEQLNIGDHPQGVIGETSHIAKDDYGENIMNGPTSIPGEEEDYRVSGPLCTDFIAAAL